MKIKKPAVHKNWLLFISGLMWSGVGLFLIRISFRWIPFFSFEEKIAVIIAGFVLGLAIAVLGFKRLVEKNIRRIEGYFDEVCVFAFQEWKSYILIAVMMSMGLFLRTTTLIPRQLIAPVYVAIGVALFSDSFLYYRRFFLKRNEEITE